MSIPHNLTRTGRAAYFAALALTPHEEKTRWRTVTGGRVALQKALGMEVVAMNRAISACVANKVMRRVGRLTSPHAMLMVDASIVDGVTYCACGAQTKARYCTKCASTEARSDRSWGPQVLAMAVAQLHATGTVKPGSISTRFNLPLWREVDDDGNTKQSGAGSVVQFLLRHGLLGEEWETALREATGTTIQLDRRRRR